MATAKKTTKKKTKKEELEDDKEKIKCNYCGKKKAKSNFYKSNARIYKGNNGLMCFCKDCVASEYLSFLNQTSGNEALSIKLTCCEFSIPFCQSFCDGSITEAMNRREKDAIEKEITFDKKKQIEDSYAFGLYMKSLNSLGKKNGFKDDDFDYISNLSISEDECMSVDIFNEKARGLKVTNEMIEFWDGVKDKKKLYILEKIWNEYSNSYKITNPVHVKLFKECAFLELQSVEKRNNNINADVSENTKKIKDLLDSLKLLPKNKKDDTDNSDVCDGILIKSIENKHPVDDTQWKDKQNFYECIGAIWRGTQMKNLKIQDANNPYYDKIMKDLAIDNPTTTNNKDTEDSKEEDEVM